MFLMLPSNPLVKFVSQLYPKSIPMAIAIDTITTFTDFILEEQHTHKRATGRFTLLLEQIARSAKIIGSHVRESGLADILGQAGRKNAFAEEVQRLDEYSNQLLIKTLTTSEQVYAIISEEEDKPIMIDTEHRGEYIVFLDPLDGSSNIDTNAPIGTIFSIYHKDGGLLQKGREQIAAGYVMYGASTMLVYTTGERVDGFTLDPSIGSFLLSHPNIRIPEVGNMYSLNEAYSNHYDTPTKKFLEHVKQAPKVTSRYVGSLIADVHRTLLKGGIFLYPTDIHHPEGKLRLLLEVNPMALLTEAAGGMVWTPQGNPLEVLPVDIHERFPVILGSKESVTIYKSFYEHS